MWLFNKKKWIPKVGDRVFFSAYHFDKSYYDATIVHIKEISIRNTYWVIKDDCASKWNSDLSWSDVMGNGTIYVFNSDNKNYHMIPMTDEDKRKLPTPKNVIEFLQEQEKMVSADIPVFIEKEIKELLLEMSSNDLFEVLHGIRVKK